MFTVHPIPTLDLPGLAPYRSMRLQEEQRQQGIFVAEGDKVVRRLLAHSNFGVESLLLPTPRLSEFEKSLALRPENIPVYLAEKHVLEELTGYPLYQGILALGRIPPAPRWEDLLANQQGPRLWIAVDGLTNAPNLGAVVRSAVAFGTQAILVGETSTSPWLRRAVRSSMGAVFDIAVVETENLAGSLEELRAGGTCCLAAEPGAPENSIQKAALARDCCIVLGNEGSGVSNAVRHACDRSIAIPMNGGVDSLNVACAASVLLYEAWRQRNERA